MQLVRLVRAPRYDGTWCSLLPLSQVVRLVPWLVFALVFVGLTWANFSPARSHWTAADAVHFSDSVHPELGNVRLPWPFADGQVPYKHDPRLLPALWLNWIASGLDRNLELNTQLTLPFRWGSFLDLAARIHLVADSIALLGECRTLSAFLGKDALPCEEIASPAGFPNSKITGHIDGKFSVAARNYVGANYLMYSAPTPLRAMLLGVGPQDGEHAKAVVIPLTSVHTVFEKSDILLMVEEFQTRSEETHLNLQQEIHRFKRMWFQSDAALSFHLGAQLPYDTFRFEEQSALGTSLSKKEFTMPQSQLESYFDSRIFSSKGNHNALDRVLAQNVLSTINSNFSGKYFHEAELAGSHSGSHFDWRFFQRAEYSDYEHRVIMHRLSRAWLRFARLAQLKTWLAHGTLLGWYWNGLNMPWDRDVDVQMTTQSLFLLARNYNQTVVVDYTDDADTAGVHLYFVDVSPYFYDRSHGDGANVIDARFIDVETGLYVDITGLAISDDYAVSTKVGRKSRELHQVFDPEYNAKIESARKDSGMDEYVQLLAKQEHQLWEKGHLYNCKNFHFYLQSELEPLMETHFEGERAYVPRSFEAIIKREYSKGLVNRLFKDWLFRPFLGLWVPRRVCKGDRYGSKCNDAVSLAEEQLTRGIRLSKGNWQRNIEDSARLDPWLMSHNHALHAMSKTHSEAR